jgi:putative membrane protein
VGFLLRLLVNAVALWAATQVVTGVHYEGDVLPFLVVALIFGVINATLRPLTKLVTCPLILLTLGLFTFIVNGLMLWLTSGLAESLGLGFPGELWPLRPDRKVPVPSTENFHDGWEYRGATGRTTPCTATGRNQARAAVAKSAPIIQASGTWARVNRAPTSSSEDGFRFSASRLPVALA